MRARPAAVTAAVASAVVLAAVPLATAAAKVSTPATPPAATPTPKALAVTATPVTGLYPTDSVAQAETVNVTITTDSGGTSTLQALTGVASMPAGSRCDAGDVEVLGYDAGAPGAPTYQLSKKQPVTVPVKVRLKNTAENQDACKATAFTITYSATAAGK